MSSLVWSNIGAFQSIAMKAEEQYLDILQNIEFAIIQDYRENPNLIDMDVRDAVDALLRVYGAEERQYRPPVVQLAEKPARLFEAVKDMCEWRLGRPTQSLQAGEASEVHTEPVTVGEILICLKRIQKSIRRWNKQGGRQGYLDFASQFLS